jgi:hypothetical protein
MVITAPARFHHEGTKATKAHESTPEIAQEFFGQQHIPEFRGRDGNPVVCSSTKHFS